MLFLLLLITTTVCTLVSPANAEDIPKFTNVTDQEGLNNSIRLGHTAAWGDYNVDGYLDIVMSSTQNIFRRMPQRRTIKGGATHTEQSADRSFYLYAGHKDNKFRDVSGHSGFADVGVKSVSWADYDNDGFPDLVVGTIMAGKPPILYKNVDGFSFLDVSEKSGLTKHGATVNHLLWSDFDADGYVDLFQASSGGVLLYHNNGNGTFSEVSKSAGLGDLRKAYGAVWFDADNDGDQDLFVASGGKNHFFRNNGKSKLSDATEAAGLAGEPTWRSAAACAGDYNGDGFIDLYVSNIGKAKRNALYKNNKDGTFTDVTWQTKTGDAGDGRTCAWVDFDADGKLDLLSTNHIQPTKLYRNMGRGTFVNVADDAGVDTVRDVFAATWGDYDRDGFIDVFFNGHDGTALLRNGGNKNNSLTLLLTGDGIKSNKSAIGARVSVTTAAGVQVREVSGGRGCCEQDMLPLYFGMGDETTADIDVTWPSGKKCVFKGISVAESNELAIREIKCEINDLS